MEPKENGGLPEEVACAKRTRRALRRERVIKDRFNPLEVYSDEEILKKLHMPRHLIVQLCRELKMDLQRDTNRGSPPSVVMQVTILLHYLAGSSLYSTTSDLFGLCTASVCRVTHDTIAAICKLAPKYLKFPLQDEFLSKVKQGFQSEHGFPGVVGALGTIHAALRYTGSPDSSVFENKHNYHSVKVQFLCDANSRLLNVVAKFPGSASDADIWEGSRISWYFEQGMLENCWVLGGHGYPLRPWLLKKIPNALSLPEQKYNQSHENSMNAMKRCIHLLKARFRKLDRNVSGDFLFSPAKVCKAVVAIAVLHNMCVTNGVPLQDEDLLEAANEDDGVYEGDKNDGEETRQWVIQEYFANDTHPGDSNAVVATNESDPIIHLQLE